MRPLMLLSAMAAADRGENMLAELSMGTTTAAAAGSFAVSTTACCVVAIASSGNDRDLCSAIMVITFVAPPNDFRNRPTALLIFCVDRFGRGGGSGARNQGARA
jgi:hypothetical protein